MSITEKNKKNLLHDYLYLHMYVHTFM